MIDERSGMMTMEQYQTAVMRTASNADLTVYVLGLAGESGEVADMLKKHLGHKHDLDKPKMAKELGDVLWYVAACADMLGYTLEDVARMNIEKLKARYPFGFDPERSKNRKPGDE